MDNKFFLKHEVEKNARERILIEQLLASKMRVIKFSKDLEQKFIRYQNDISVYQIRSALFFALGFFLFTFFVDYNFEDFRTYFISLRVYASIPVILVLLSSYVFKNYLTYQENFSFISLITTTLGMLTLAHWHDNPFLKEFYYISFLLIELWVIVLARIRFWDAVFFISFIIVLFNIFFHFEAYKPFNVMLFNTLFMSSGLFVILISFFQEYSHRMSFLSLRLIELKNDVLVNLAHIDPVTNIPNRRDFDMAFERELRRAIRYDYPLALMLIDIRGFKKFNEKYGQAYSDSILISAAQVVIQFARRAGDAVARFEGDKFIILLNDVKVEAMPTIAERLSQTFAKTEFKVYEEEPSFNINTAIGMTIISPNKDNKTSQILSLLEEALKKAKQDESRGVFINHNAATN